VFPDRDAARWYLAALIDGEGHVGKRKHKGKKQGFTREVRITNTDASIVRAAEEALTVLGVAFKTYTRSDRAERENVFGSKPLHDVVVSHKDGMDVILAEVPLQCEYKLERLKESLGSYVRKNRPSQAELEAHLADGLSDAKIAAVYGVTAGAVWFWRKHYGLERG